VARSARKAVFFRKEMIMELVWYPSPGHETETLEAVKNEDSRIRGGLGFEPLTAIASVLAVAALIRVLTKLYRDTRYKGVLIDATRHPVEVREMPGWSRRQVLVITSRGAQFYVADADEGTEKELHKIAELLRND
jgi:hypothetical protein